MAAEHASDQPPIAVSERTILAVVAVYAAAFVLFGLALQSPSALLSGLAAIVTTRDALLTDYFGVGGIGGGCVNAGLADARGGLRLLADRGEDHRRVGRRAVSGAGVRPLRQEPLQRLVLVLGVWLYARFRGSRSRGTSTPRFSGPRSRPSFSEILFSTAIPFTLASRSPSPPASRPGSCSRPPPRISSRRTWGSASTTWASRPGSSGR